MTGDVATVTTRIIVGRRINMIEYMLNMVRTLLEFSGYVVKFSILIGICWIISMITPLTCWEASILMMIFWFLNLYHVK